MVATSSKQLFFSKVISLCLWRGVCVCEGAAASAAVAAAAPIAAAAAGEKKSLGKNIRETFF